MALAADDFVKETSTTTGTGTYDLAGAVTGFQGFVAGIGNGNTCWYLATNGTDWEVGIGTVTDAAPDTLSRDTILSSSNADSAVSWAAGSKTITCTLPASIGLSKGLARAPQVYTTTGQTWSKPANLSFIVVEAVGGGGGGAGGSTTHAHVSTGGGAGGYCRKTIAASALGATESVTAGTGGTQGTSGAAGSAGSSSVFGTSLLAIACGGAGGNFTGIASALPGGGSGGLATGGDLNVQGGDGSPGAVALNAVSGATTAFGLGPGWGGISYFGGGGANAQAKALTGATAVGQSGKALGSGGAAGLAATGTGTSGGPGAGGVVIVWEFI